MDTAAIQSTQGAVALPSTDSIPPHFTAPPRALTPVWHQCADVVDAQRHSAPYLVLRAGSAGSEGMPPHRDIMRLFRAFESGSRLRGSTAPPTWTR